MSQTAIYNVPDISCNHCKNSIEGEVSQVQGVETVHIDVKAKTVKVVAEPLDNDAIVAAIGEAGYEVVAA